MRKWNRRKKRLAIWMAAGGIGISVLIYAAPEAGKSAVRKTMDHLYGLFSNLTQEWILDHYSYLSYYMEGGGGIQNAVAEKIGQIVPLGNYVSEKTGGTKENEETKRESYPMMLPTETESTVLEAAQSQETEVPEETMGEAAEAPVDAGASGILIQPQNEILPQIRRLPALGGYTLEQMQDFQYLTEHLYVVDPSTSITENELNPKVLLAKDLSISDAGSGPQILIYHTHSQETYVDSVPGNEQDTIVGVGDYLAEILTDTYGYQVLHHKGVYDMTDGVLDRDPAYEKALPDLEQILEDNKSIEVVIDLHRDGVDESVHLVTDIDGKPTAKLMFFNGTCRDANGERSDISNPYREDNLAFSLQMALTACAEYPDLTRVIYLKTNRYNQHLRARSALVEVGAQTNTVEEAKNAMPILADLIDQVIRREK